MIQSAGLVKTQSLLIVATGGVTATIELDNGGTIAGLAPYVLNPGTVLEVVYDGTNLNP